MDDKNSEGLNNYTGRGVRERESKKKWGVVYANYLKIRHDKLWAFS